MPDLSVATINILGWSKIILFIFLAVGTWLIYRKKQKPENWLVLFGAAVFIFYAVMSAPLKKMFWGDSGDEVYIFSFLTRAMSAHPFGDYFYAHLPAFYPPLYFWATGFFAKFFVHSGIGAAKIGALGVFFLWFFGVYFLQKFYWIRKSAFVPLSGTTADASEKTPIISSPWFWLALPLAAWLINDFNDLLLKPYEAISAIFLVIWLGFLAQELSAQRWTWKKYLFFGVSGGLLFLTYYFWWFMVVIALAAWIISEKNKILNSSRIIFTGAIIFIVSLPYILPLALSYFRQGMDNFQASYFYYAHFATFAPITAFNFKAVLFILGLIGLIIYRQNKFIRINLFLFLSCYLYQFLNLIFFAAHGQAFQAQKAFPLLASISLSVGTAYLLVDVALKNYQRKYFREAALIVLILAAINLPFGAFIEDKIVLDNLNNDLTAPQDLILAQEIKKEAPDYADRIWLSSGAPELNAFLPINYYLAFNSQFSHPAANWSKRFVEVKNLTAAKTPEDFQDKWQAIGAEKFNAMLLYYNRASSSYSIFYWQNDFPNAGAEAKLDLNPKLIGDKYWQKVFDNGDWKIFLAK
jgi:hypothetical protein